MVVRIQKSKTDNHNRKKGRKPGRTVEIVAQEDRTICAVHWCKRYMTLRKLTADKHFFQGVNSEAGLATTTPYHAVKRMVKLIGLDEKEYGSHSLRRGGATDAVRNGAEIEDVRALGGWSEGSQTVQKYVERSGTGAAVALAKRR